MPSDLIEEPHLERMRRIIVEQYEKQSTGCGGDFGELLCYEIHNEGLTFIKLSKKWGINLTLLGELLADHCRRLEEDPCVLIEDLERRAKDD